MRFIQASAAIGIAAVTLPMAIQAEPATVLHDTVVSADAGSLQEEQPTGAYGQPEWVSHRRFSNTRVYIQKSPWEVGVEEWYRLRTFDDGQVTQRFQQEIEIGLPYRMQLDLYEKTIHDNADEDKGWHQDEFAVELRWAPADWGKIWGNPTFYEEWAFIPSGPDVLESKLLLGDDCNGWHWGLNFICEQEMWGKEETTWSVAAGLSRVVIDNKLSVGLESQWTHPEGGNDEYILGPSIQWLPTDKTHLDLVAMAGLNEHAPNMECWLIFGFDFGSGEKGRGYKPTSVGGGL